MKTGLANTIAQIATLDVISMNITSIIKSSILIVSTSVYRHASRELDCIFDSKLNFISTRN